MRRLYQTCTFPRHTHFGNQNGTAVGEWQMLWLNDRGKLVGAAALIAVAVGVYLFFGREATSLPSRIEFVSVDSGQVFGFSPEDVPGTIPGKNPGTDKLTLLPCIRREGKLFVQERYAKALLDLGPENQHVDPKTLEVRNAK